MNNESWYFCLNLIAFNQTTSLAVSKKEKILIILYALLKFILEIFYPYTDLS
jgi:hypothetical protein